MAEYPFKVICDTSIYIPFINQGIAYPAVFDETSAPLLYMSTVVVSELYAGAHDSQSIKVLDKLYHAFKSVGRLLVPNDEDWRQTGGIMAKSKKKYGYDSTYLSRLQNDILIACSARRIGAFVLTKNKLKPRHHGVLTPWVGRGLRRPAPRRHKVPAAETAGYIN